jgi:Domain of unknown function (DUF4113)
VSRAERTRTSDTWFRKPLLYPLSYSPMSSGFTALSRRFNPYGTVLCEDKYILANYSLSTENSLCQHRELYYVYMRLASLCTTQVTTPQISKSSRCVTSMSWYFGFSGLRNILFGAQGIGRAWKMRQERRSPRYTTRWGDILVVRT